MTFSEDTSLHLVFAFVEYVCDAAVALAAHLDCVDCVELRLHIVLRADFRRRSPVKNASRTWKLSVDLSFRILDLIPLCFWCITGHDREWPPGVGWYTRRGSHLRRP